jgi:hypothetical protein
MIPDCHGGMATAEMGSPRGAYLSRGSLATAARPRGQRARRRAATREDRRNHLSPPAFRAWDGPMANSSIEYRRHAEDCLRLAEHAGSPDAKSLLLLMMASAWHRLAQDLVNIERPAEGVEAACTSEERQADV